MNAEQRVPSDPMANDLAKLLLVTQLAALDGSAADLTELSAKAEKFIREHQHDHDHLNCLTCNQIYRDAYRTGYMHAGGDTSKLPQP